MLGYSTDPEGTIDLVAAIDSAFKVVETSNPECITETARWRGQKGWISLVNGAIEKMNSDQPDSAEYLARRAIMLNPYAPYGYVVLGNVKQKANATADAIDLYGKAVEVAQRDTAYAEIRRQSLVYLGNLAADTAESADAAAKPQFIAKAREAFQALLADKDAKDQAASARQGMCRVLVASGDTAQLRVTYKDPLAAPSTFSYPDIMSAGVCLARAEMVPEAATLFQAAYDKNPYHLDALSNLAIMLLRQDKVDQSLPLAERLVTVEPNNPENLQLLMLSYAGIAKRARDARLGTKPAAGATKTTGTKQAAAAKPAAPKLSQATSDSLFKIEKAYTDSAVTTNDKKEKLAYKVQLTNFQTTDQAVTVSGIVTNQGDDDKAVTVHVDFLDKDGKPIASKDVAVGTIAAHRTAKFSATTNPAPGISAFRYAIQ